MPMWFSRSKSNPEPEAPFFVWSKQTHSVGITVFDQEHQKLAALMNRVHAALKEKHDRDLALQLFHSLISETRAHFDHEERVMNEVSSPGREDHIEEHATLIREVQAQLQLLRNGAISSLAIPDFIKAWLIPHMQYTDRKYAASLRRHGFP